MKIYRLFDREKADVVAYMMALQKRVLVVHDPTIKIAPFIMLNESLCLPEGNRKSADTTMNSVQIVAWNIERRAPDTRQAGYPQKTQRAS